MEEKTQKLRKGIGAQQKIANRFNELSREREYTDYDIEELNKKKPIELIEVYPKTIVNKVTSPDLSMMYSMNPYQGCEHGCVYCYARNSHEYWGYGAGEEFERKILIKRNAPELLAAVLAKKSWSAYPIMVSGNTDCYQPIERKEELTKKVIQTFWKYKHPFGIITKNSLILRDVDVLQDLAKHNLVHVTISMTSLQEEIRQKLEPRTASVKQKLKTIHELSSLGIPTQVMMGPIIPALNNHEVFDIAKAAADNGALNMVTTMIRLNGHLGALFTDWIDKAFPTKAKHVLSLIKQVHNGKLNDSRWGIRKTGEGEIATMIHRTVELAKARNFRDKSMPAYNLELHKQYKNNQLNLFYDRE